MKLLKWLSGAALAVLMTGGIALAQSPAVVGQWSQLYSWPEVPVHMVLLPDTRVLTFTDPAYNGGAKTPAAGYVVPIPAGGIPGAAVHVSQGTDDIFCAGATFFPSGNVMVAGGTNMNGVDGPGTPAQNIFDWQTTAWSQGTAMHFARWYPTTTELPNGEVLVLSGSQNSGYTNASIPEVSTNFGAGPWTELTSANMKLTLYPRAFDAPNGRIFIAAGGSPPGANQNSYWLNTSGLGAWTAGPKSLFGNRFNGTAVEYANGEILIAGGTNNFGVTNATNTAEVININLATPVWTYTNPMAFPRQYLNSTLLPDENVLITGGSGAPGNTLNSLAVLEAEEWNPSTGKWTTMASMNHARMYHSTAMLLPDGRVLSGGSTTSGITGDDVDFFSPPYLFKGARPVITSAPASVTHGQVFMVQTPSAVTKVTLVSLPAVTHAFNENQRLAQLKFTAVAGGLSITAPPNVNSYPPGYYMLFLLNSSGVPSVAKIIQVI